MNDQEEAVKLLLENSETDVTVEADNGLGINGFTILMWEVRNGHEETVKMLLQNSEIDVNAGEVNCTFIKDTGWAIKNWSHTMNHTCSHDRNPSNFKTTFIFYCEAANEGIKNSL